MIDYAAAQKLYRKQKAALTRALNTSDPQARRVAVVKAATKAVHEWNGSAFNGAWPDDWARWQRALDDVHQFPLPAPRLDTL